MMQPVPHQKRQNHPHARWLLLGAVLLLLLGALLFWKHLDQPAPDPVPSESTSGVLAAHTAAEVAALTVTDRSGESWQAVQRDGGLQLTDAPDFPVSAQMEQQLLESAAMVTYLEVLAESSAEYEEHLAELGLDQPWMVSITYTDGTALTLQIGDENRIEEPFTYLRVVGDERLYAMDITSAENLCVERALLHEVVQPVLHKARMDRITFWNEKGDIAAAWELQGAITAGDAEDHWLETVPVRYPADGEAIDRLKSNLSNLRLGAYVAEGTAENLAKYGLASPRFTLQVHQAAGEIYDTDEEGQVVPVAWAADECTLSVGDARSDVVDYVLYEGAIYRTSHFSLETLMTWDARETLTRYVVPMPLANLQRLTLRTGDGTTVYEVERDEETNPETGETEIVNSVTRNGEAMSYSAFEAAYQALLLVTVSGELPAEWSALEEPHTVYTFRSVTGEEREVALLSFDPLHDAVRLDGEAVFYLIRGGMELESKSE